MMEVRRVVFDGLTGLGWLTIFEGDEVDLAGNLGVAFYSTTYTHENQQNSCISIRLPNYHYGNDPENCHSWHSSKLLHHKRKGPRVVNKSGFGRWIAKCST